MSGTRIRGCASMAVLLLFGLSSGAAQETQNRNRPISQVTAYTFPEGSTFDIPLQGTDRLPGGEGMAKVVRQGGHSKLEVKLRALKPANYFGGQINTYVLWAISPQLQFDNLGEFVLDGHRSRLKVSTPFQAFALMVTAEPHFLVSTPSRLVIIESEGALKHRGFFGFLKGSAKPAQLSTVPVDLQDRLQAYRTERTQLGRMPEARGKVRTEIDQAAAALGLAESAGAKTHAGELFNRARGIYREAVSTFENGDQRAAAELAHEAIRLSVKAEKAGVAGRQRAALEDERQRHREEVERAVADGERALAEEQKARAEERRKLQAALQKAVGKVVQIRQTAEGLVINLPELLFASDRAKLNPESREVLSRLTGILQVVDGFGLRIEGHTDSTGSEEYNQSLSLKRAEAVRDYLVDGGLPESIAEAYGHGESQPVADNGTRDGRSKNRRVEILIHETEKFTVDIKTDDVGN